MTWEGYTQLQNDGTWGALQEAGNLPDPAGARTSNFPVWNTNTTAGVSAEGPGMMKARARSMGG